MVKELEKGSCKDSCEGDLYRSLIRVAIKV